MKLISSPASPYARKARVLIHEAGLADQVQEVPVKTTPMATDSSVAAANPLGKIPALLRDEGPAIYDSRVICRFLDTHASAGLYPDSRIWEVLTLEATADGILDSAISMVYERRFRPENMQSEDWVEAQWAKVSRSLDALGKIWISHLSGPLDMGQIALGCALGYLDFRHGDRGWRQGRGALDDWFAAFSERPAMQATTPGD
ncbi:glutathione S-transferase [Lutimaribacter sp. EGI FJ00015]|uniref:Glutathione S-transferase n=1 Tax=Lutimaribacter degradans TaxID=2945989 RepID=A0ACC6A287_9RHOB|nr:glutathione S-transferase [Lutimaribacter sp. EGI FJ00013]MCM2563699.1 glutathione S-transferase [Lutimaribacter sp. EGI FJ00013]MCO0614883.1 glutathione S-transferase [Lutimaribacter sp. EGI FJ00015]MCO0637551.1 glutathione S-transferase [Lutimaribacter sp. EGI FJ00014]